MKFLITSNSSTTSRNFHRFCCYCLYLHFIFTVFLASYLLLKHTFKLPSLNFSGSFSSSSSSSSSSTISSSRLPSFPSSSFTSSAQMSEFYSLSAKDAQNNVIQFSDFKNKVILIVNVASKCGFTPQYEGLEALYREFKDRSFVLLGFPCNDFLNQEPDDEATIVKTCKLKYDVTFPIMSKITLKGENKHPVYQYLEAQKPNVIGLKNLGFKVHGVKWNFEKFLIGKDGTVRNRWTSMTKPADLRADIEAAINENTSNKL